MPSLFAGTVTFLFTEIEASKAPPAAAGERNAQLLAGYLHIWYGGRTSLHASPKRELSIVCDGARQK